MNKKEQIGAGMLVFALCAPLQADVLHDNFGDNDFYDTISYTISDGSPLNTDRDQGEKLLFSEDYYLDQVDAAMGLLMGQNIMNLSLYSDDGGLPGVILETSTVVDQMGPMGTVNPPVVFTFSGTTQMYAGTTYWLIGSSENDTWAGWGKNTIGEIGVHAQRTELVWDLFDNSTVSAYRLYGSAVPTPSSLCLLAFGGFAASSRRRRRC